MAADATVTAIQARLRFIPLLTGVCVLGLAFALPDQVRAQAVQTCDTCVRDQGCTSRQDNCSAECRARYFSVDRRRDQCTAACATAATACAQTASQTCRAANACK